MKKNIILILFAAITQFISAQHIVNYLDSDTYGLEAGGDGWYLQHADYWSFSTDKAANGLYSLKFTCNDSNITFAPKAQASGLGLTCDAGTYTMKVKVWVEEACTVKGFSINIKHPWKAVSWDISGVTKGEWVELSKEITLTGAANASGINIQVNTADLGTGYFFIDDISIWGEGEEPVEDMSLTSEVSTNTDALISLTKGLYVMSLKVWIDEETSISGFYTAIEEPYCSQEWDLTNAVKGEWLNLSQEFTLEADAVDAPFRLISSNHPEYFGGTGTIYIDDIQIAEADVSIGSKLKAFEYNIYPNPANSILNIEAPLGSSIKIVNISGETVKLVSDIDSKQQVSVSGLYTGVYFVLISNNGTTESEKIIIK